MLKKKERLNRETFNRFFSMGKRYHSPSLTLIYTKDDSFCGSAVISKKVGKTAVLRNKFRRRVYSTLHTVHREKKITGIYIILAKQGAASLSYDALKTELHDLIHKISALR